jgi:Ca2+-dependent lipid-binding protein
MCLQFPFDSATDSNCDWLLMGQFPILIGGTPNNMATFRHRPHSTSSTIGSMSSAAGVSESASANVSTEKVPGQITQPASELPSSAGSLFPFIGLLGLAAGGSFLVGYYRWSVLWCCIILGFAYMLLSRRVARFRLYHRHAVDREAAKVRLSRHVESTEWLNFVLERLWTVLEPALCVRVTEKVNTVLENSCPSFLDSLELAEFTLGSSAPLILGAQVHPQTEPNVIHLDAELCFIPNEIEDDRGQATAMAQWNSKIVLTARVGKGIVGVDIPVMLKEISFYGKLRVQLELAPTLPFVSKVQIAFLERPKLDFILKPLKSLDIMDLPGLSNWLSNMIAETLEAKIVDPNMVTIPLTRSYSDVRSIGVLKVSLFQIRGVKLAGTMASPFVRIQQGSSIRAVSHTIDKESGEWNEVFYVLIHTLKSALVFVVMGSPILMVGSVTIPITDIDQDASASQNVWRTLVGHESSKIRGELNFGIEYFPAAEAPDPEADLNFESGIIQISVHQLKDMLESDRKILNCLYEVIVHRNGTDPSTVKDPNYRYRSKPKKRTNSPTWEEVFEVFAQHKDDMSITIIIWHATKEDVTLGRWSAPFSALMNRTDWFRFEDTPAKEAQFYASFLFRPVRIDLRGASESRPTPCLGVLRVRVISATGLKTGRGGYHVSVDLNGRSIGKTRSSLVEATPVWNRNMVSVVKDSKATITLDVQHTGKGTSHGHVTCTITELMNHQGCDIEKNEPLQDSSDGQKHQPGRLRFTVGIYPIKREDPTPADEEEVYPVMVEDQVVVKSNCGVLEIQSVAVKGIFPTTIHSLHFIQISFNHGDVCYSTVPARVTLEDGHQEWKKYGALIVRDPDVIDLCFAIKETQGLKDEFVDAAIISLHSAMSNTWIKMDGITQGLLMIRARYRPLPLLLEPEVEEAGILKFHLLDAQDLIALDSGGTSDPFCVARLNGEKVYKSKVIKKSLTPVWNESAEIHVKQRDVSTLQIELRDWNKVTASRSLGLVSVDLQNLPPDQWQDLKLNLENVSSGVIHFRLNFIPEQTGRGPRRPTQANTIAVSSTNPPTTEFVSEPASTAASTSTSTSTESLPTSTNEGKLEGSLENIPEDEELLIASASQLPDQQIDPQMLIAKSTSPSDMRGSFLTPQTAAGLRITLVELLFDGDHEVFELKLKVRRDDQTIFKTRAIKGSEYRWNESFTVDADVITQHHVYQLLVVGSKKQFEFTLDLSTLDLKGTAENELVMPIMDTADLPGKLIVRYTLTNDTHSLISDNHKRRFSFLGMTK